MLILHILAPAEVGGLEHVVHLLAQGQARSGEEVHVAAVLDGAGAADQLLHSLGPVGSRRIRSSSRAVPIGESAPRSWRCAADCGPTWYTRTGIGRMSWTHPWPGG